MDTKALRQKILDLAIRGKLVPQDPNDEPASVLLERIRAEKQQMVKDGKLKPKDIKNDTVIFKGDDNLHYEKFSDGNVKCIEDEIPFDIPNTWSWCRLNNIGSTNIGLTYSPSDICNDGTMVLRSSNIVNGKIDLADLVKVKSDIRKNQYLQNGDILICARNGSKRLVGKCALFLGIKEPASFGAFMAVYRSDYNRYIYYFLCTDIFRNTFASDDSKQINQLTQDMIKNTLLPLPPLNEQNRIVKSLNNAFIVVDKIEESKTNLKEDIQKTKSKILDLAIRGKLVPQDPNDEPASVLLERIRAEKEELIKQGKIKRDKKESVIFKGDDNSYYQDLPSNWIKIRLSTISEIITKGTTPRGGKVAYSQSGIGFLRAENIAGYDKLDLSNLNYIDEESHNNYLKRSILKENDILITIAGTLGRTAIVTQQALPLNTNQAVAIVRLVNNRLINVKYLVYALNSPIIKSDLLAKSVDMAIPNLSLENIADCNISLPPLSEQKRIVEAIEKIFAVLDDIANQVA